MPCSFGSRSAYRQIQEQDGDAGLGFKKGLGQTAFAEFVATGLYFALAARCLCGPVTAPVGLHSLVQD